MKYFRGLMASLWVLFEGVCVVVGTVMMTTSLTRLHDPEYFAFGALLVFAVAIYEQVYQPSKDIES